MAQVSGHIRRGACRALNEVVAVETFGDRLFRNLWTVSGGMPADCPVSRVSGLDRHVGRPCREAGGWCPLLLGLAVPVLSRADRRTTIPRSRLYPFGGAGADRPEPLDAGHGQRVC